MGSFVFPDGPGTSAIARLMRVNFFEGVNGVNRLATKGEKYY